jgi:hypothetical protein
MATEFGNSGAANKTAAAPGEVSRDGGKFVEGIVERLKVDQQGKQIVLNSVIRTRPGTAVAIYMAGPEVRGILETGDLVRTRADPKRSPGDTLRVTHLENLTTQCVVSVWTPPLLRRLAGILGPILLTAIITSLVGGLITATLFSGGGKAGAPVGPDERPGGGGGSTGPSGGVAVLLVAATLLLVAVLAFRFFYVRPRRKRRAAFLSAAASAGQAEQAQVPR